MYRTIREEVAIFLRNKILKGEIKQGDRIKEAEIAEELGISRGPIREAFRQLEQEGLITYSARRGCTVKTISATDAAELYLLRATLENLAVKMCKGKYKEDTLKRLELIVDKMDEFPRTEDLIHIIEFDQLFHELIVKEANMQKLYEMWSALNSSNTIIFYALYHSKYAPNDKFADNHRAIFNLIVEGNFEKICKELQEHYLIVAKNLYKTENLESSLDFDIVL